jgi:branched-chain amino acid transport system permease protein
MRAVANDIEVAHMMGINVNKVFVISWGVAAISAAVAGVFLSGIETVNLSLGDSAIKAIPVFVLGGVQSFPGVIVGGLVIGVVEVLIGYFIGSEFRTPVVFAILLLILILRPYGFFGESKVQRV